MHKVRGQFQVDIEHLADFDFYFRSPFVAAKHAQRTQYTLVINGF
jgi:hypothetical protein